MSERTTCGATGADLLRIDLPRGTKPKEEPSAKDKQAAAIARRYVRQTSQLQPAKVQLPASAEGDASPPFVVASLDISGFAERSRSCRPLAVHEPGLLVGQTIVVERSQDANDDGGFHSSNQPYVL